MADKSNPEGFVDPDNEGVSPVVGATLMVAITVVLASIIAFFFLSASPTSPAAQDVALRGDYQTDSAQITLLTGAADSLEVQVDGETVYMVDSPKVGDSFELPGMEEGESVSVVAVHNEEETVVYTESAPMRVNAPAVVPAMADLIVDQSTGDDTDPATPYKTIQGAVDGASAGDTILVRAGAYDEKVNIPYGVTIVGEEGAAIDRQSSRDSKAFKVTADASAPFEVQGLDVKDVQVGILVESSDAVISLEDVSFTDIEGTGLGEQGRVLEYFGGNGDITLRNVQMTDIGYGVDIHSHDTGVIELVDVTVDDSNYDVIDIDTDNEVTLQNININDGVQKGIRLRGTATYDLSDSVVKGQDRNAVELRGQSDVTITNTDVISNVRNGILIRTDIPVTISDSRIDNNGDKGIVVETTALVDVDRTSIDSNQYGVEAGGNNDIEIHDSTINGSHWAGFIGVGQTGSILIEDSAISGSARDELDLRYADSASIELHNNELGPYEPGNHGAVIDARNAYQTIDATNNIFLGGCPPEEGGKKQYAGNVDVSGCISP